MANQLSLDIEALNRGKTIGEKHGILNKIYKSANEKKYTNTELNSYLKAGWNKDKFHIILYVYFVNHTKAEEIFLKLLKTEDDKLIWYTIKGCSFMWTDKKYSSHYYVSEIFPFISYSNRLKLLKEIARNLNNKERSQEFFIELNTSYGQTMARPFLERCGPTFLLENLRRGIILKSTELRRLLPEKFDFVIDYLSELTTLAADKKNILNSTDFSKYKNVVRKLLMLDHQRIVNNNKKVCKEFLGKKLSKRILTSSAKKIIIDDSKYFENIIPKKMLFKHLSKDDFYIFYKNLFPEKFTSLSGNIYEYLDYYKNREEKLNALLNAYQEVYGEELLNKLTNLTENVLGLLETDRRCEYANKLIEIERLDTGDVDTFVCYLPCKTSLTKFKKSIYSTSDMEKRTAYLRFMLQTCAVNDDMDALLEVLIYFNQRHRNDQREVSRAFIDDIAQKIDHKKLTEKHFEEIEKILDIISLNNDWAYLYNTNDLLIQHIKYNHINKLPAKKSHINYIKFVHRCRWATAAWNVFPDNSDIGKKILCALGDIMPEVLPKIGKRTTLSYLESIASWNKKHPKDTVSATTFPWIINNITEIIEKQKRSALESILDHLQYDQITFEALGSKLANLKLNLKHLRNTIKTDSELVRNNMKEICEEILSLKHPNKIFFPLLKSGELKAVDGFEEYIKEYCLNIVNTEITEQEPNKLKPAAMRILIYWLRPEEFFSIAQSNYPTQTEAPVGSDAAATKYNFQKYIALGIKNYKDYPEAFQAITRFCIGDYLKLAIGSLKSVCIKTTFQKSDAYLNLCIDAPVSLKKHIIRLKFLLNNKTVRLNFIKNMWIAEKNRSIREIILKYTIQIFKAEPDSMLWSLLKSYFDSLTSQDFYITEVLTEFKDIPKDYYSAYIELCWNTVNRLEAKTKDVRASKINILKSIGTSLAIASPEVVDKLLTENLFKMNGNTDVQNAICTLAAKYLLYCTENDQKQNHRIDLITLKTKEAFDTNWNTIETFIKWGTEYPSYPARTNINHMLGHISTFFVKEESPDFNIVAKFKDNLNKICDPIIFMYSSYLKLELVLIYKKCNKNFLEFGKSIRDLVDGHILIYGEYIVPEFAETLKSLPITFQALEMAEGLLSEPLQSDGCALLALHFLDFNVIRAKENTNLLQKLMKVNDKKVQIMLNGYNKIESKPCF